MVHSPAGADDFDAFVNFVETTVGKGFISLLDSLMQKIIIDILHRASDSGRWAGGYTLPDTVLQTATHALVNLSDIQNRSSAADFLAGMSPSTTFCSLALCVLAKSLHDNLALVHSRAIMRSSCSKV